MNKKIFTLFVLLLLLPVTALAAEEIKLFIGGLQITESGCYANQNGTWTKVEGTGPSSGQFYYDAATFTLTLNQAEITHDQTVKVAEGYTYEGSVIAFSQTADVSLKIVVSQGTSTITGTGGIRVESTTGNASLSIKGSGSLDVEPKGSNSGITLCSSKNTNLDIDGADVTASSPAQYGVYLISSTDATSTSTITVNNGSLTTGGNGNVGIYYYWSGTSNAGTSSLTVSGNAVVDTRNSQIMAQNKETVVQVGAGSDGNGGIVFNGKNGTVYGDVTLQEDLEIGEGESLTIPEDASLNANGKLTNDGTIIVKGELTGDVEGNGSIPITNITLDKTVLSLDVDKTAMLRAMITPEQATDEAVTWISNNTNIATVDENGTVTAVSVGTVIITVTTADDSKTATCEVTVAHSDLKHFDRKEATCTEPGNIEYWHCEGCGKYFKDENATEKITFDETIIKAAGHNEELVGAKEATCTEEGYTGDKICTVCKAVLKKGTVIPAIGHKLTKTEAKSPTCTEDGNIEYWTCSVCNAHFSDEAGTTEISLDETVIPATGHHYVNGYCTECGQRDPDYRPDPISYYNIYVEDVCDGVEISTSKQVVREGGSITVYVEKDTANYTFDNFKVYYKRSYYGGWEELKEGTQPGEYPIKNIWTHIYIKAEGAEEKEDPTGIKQVEGVKVYTKDGSLYVQTPQREQVIIVSMSGAVVKNEEQIGLKQYHGLQPGIYIVRVGDRAYKLRLY